MRERDKSDKNQPPVMAELVAGDQPPKTTDAQIAAGEQPQKPADGDQSSQTEPEQGPKTPGGMLLSYLDSPVIRVAIASLLIGLMLLRYSTGLVVILIFFVALLLLRAKQLAEQTKKDKALAVRPPKQWFIIGGGFYGLCISAALVFTGNMGLVGMVVCTILGGAVGFYAGRHWDEIYQILMSIFNVRDRTSTARPARTQGANWFCPRQSGLPGGSAWAR